MVIHADAGTEISLELRLRNGSIEAQAQLCSGNITALQSEWPQLQERLAKQGVHLTSLQTSDRGADGRNGNEQQSSRRDFDPLSLASSTTFQNQTKPSISMARTHAGWESWA